MTEADIDRVIELVVRDVESVRVAIGRAIVDHATDFVDASNEISLRVARRLVDGTLGYESADVVMNWLWVHVTDWMAAVDPRQLPEPMYSIYDAVDAGEYHRPDDPPDLDPVRTYTMPAIVSILESLTQ